MTESVDVADFDKTNLENLKDFQSLILDRFILFGRLNSFKYYGKNKIYKRIIRK